MTQSQNNNKEYEDKAHKIFMSTYEYFKKYMNLDEEFKHFKYYYSQEQINDGFDLEKEVLSFILSPYELENKVLLSDEYLRDSEYLNKLYNVQDDIKFYDLCELKGLYATEKDYYNFFYIDYYDVEFERENVTEFLNIDKKEYHEHIEYNVYTEKLYLKYIEFDTLNLNSFDPEDPEAFEAYADDFLYDNIKKIIKALAVEYLYTTPYISHQELNEEFEKVKALAGERFEELKEEKAHEIKALTLDLSRLYECEGFTVSKKILSDRIENLKYELINHQ